MVAHGPSAAGPARSSGARALRWASGAVVVALAVSWPLPLLVILRDTQLSAAGLWLLLGGFFALPAATVAVLARRVRPGRRRAGLLWLAGLLLATGLAGLGWEALWSGVGPFAARMETVQVDGSTITVWVNDGGAVTTFPPFTWVEQQRQVLPGVGKRWQLGHVQPATSARLTDLGGGRIQATYVVEDPQARRPTSVRVEQYRLRRHPWQ